MKIDKRCVVLILLVLSSFIIVGGSIFFKNMKNLQNKSNAISGDAGDHHVDLIATVKNIDTQNRMLDVDSDGVEYSVKYENTLDNKILRLNMGSKVHFSYWPSNMEGNSIDIEYIFN